MLDCYRNLDRLTTRRGMLKLAANSFICLVFQDHLQSESRAATTDLTDSIYDNLAEVTQR